MLEHAHRPRALPGAARHAAGGDAGQRAGRHRLQPRGPRGRRPRRRWSSTASTTTSRAWRRRPGRGGRRPPVRPCGRARRTRWRRPRSSGPTAVALQDEQVGRLAEQLPLPQIRLPFVFTAEIGPGGARPARRAPARRDRRACRRSCDGTASRLRSLRELGRAAPHPRVLRLGRRRQDHDRGGARPGGRPRGSPRRRRHDRPGQAPGRRPRARGPHRHSRAGSRATGPASCGR